MSVVGGMVYMLGRNQEKTEAAAREVIERSKADPAKIKVVTAFSVTFPSDTCTTQSYWAVCLRKFDIESVLHVQSFEKVRRSLLSCGDTLAVARKPVKFYQFSLKFPSLL